MNADEAVQAHRAWKDRLRVAMAKREVLDIEKVSSDQSCMFGKWLRAVAIEQFGDTPVYSDCLSAHKAFHLEAAKVASKINEGELLTADKMMASGTSYAKASEFLGVKVKALFNSASS